MIIKVIRTFLLVKVGSFLPKNSINISTTQARVPGGAPLAA